MNRRGLLALLGGAAAMPTVGAKSAAKALGVDLAMNTPAPIEVCGQTSPISRGWWGSPAQIAFEAKREAEYTNWDRYSHMKSWSQTYRRAVVTRELQAEKLFQRKMEADDDFFAQALSAMGWRREP